MDDTGREKMFSLQLAKRGALLKEVMPLAMRNLAIAQQRDQERYRHVRGGKYDKHKASSKVGDFVMVKQKGTSLDPPVRSHILQVVELKDSGVAILQGSDGATISHQVAQMAHCNVPVVDIRIDPKKYVRTYAVH